jgi:hypothetical protein
MKLKDSTGSIQGVKIKTPKGVVGYIKSQWGYTDGKAGVWLSDGISSQTYPQFVDSLKDILDWEITEDTANCHELTDISFIDHCKTEHF